MGKDKHALWKFFLEHISGAKINKEMEKRFSVTRPTLYSYQDICEKVLSRNIEFVGIYLDTIDSVYVSELSITQENTRVIKFTDITEWKDKPNCFVDLPNRDEILLRYYQRVYAANQHRIFENAVVIDGNSVTAMLGGYVFEKIGSFTTLDIRVILEAYQPEMIIGYEEEKGRWNELKNELAFIAMKRNQQKLLMESVNPQIISLANANWGLYQSLDE